MRARIGEDSRSDDRPGIEEGQALREAEAAVGGDGGDIVCQHVERDVVRPSRGQRSGYCARDGRGEAARPIGGMREDPTNDPGPLAA